MFQKAVKSQSKLRLALVGPSGSGKAQPLDAKILTPSGWKLMGDIQVGDSVACFVGANESIRISLSFCWRLGGVPSI